MSGSMIGSPERSGAPGFARLLPRLLSDGNVLAVATAVTTVPLFLSNNYQTAPTLLAWLFFPVAILSCCDLNALRNRPWVFGFPVLVALSGSIILVGAAIYLAAIDLSDWSNVSSGVRELKRQLTYSVQIVFFMAFIAVAVARWPKFAPRLIALIATVAAVSAAINVHSFVITLPGSVASWPSYRLVNWLGMPGYTNSTNISIMYAVLFVGCAAIVARSSGVWMRIWLSPVVLVLLTAVLLTQARSAYVGIVVGLVMIVFGGRRITRRAIMVGIAASVVLAAALVALPKTQDVIASRGASYRPEIWRIYLDRAIERPLLGYGGMSKIDIKLANNVDIDQPHNIVLSAQIRGGIFAMLAMLTMLLGSVYWSMRYARLTGSVMPLAMIATIASTSMMDYNLLITAVTWPWVTFWLPFAICAGAEIATRRALLDETAVKAS